MPEETEEQEQQPAPPSRRGFILNALLIVVLAVVSSAGGGVVSFMLMKRFMPLPATGEVKTEEAKTEDEKAAWSDEIEAYRPYDDPEKKDWFIGVCKEAGCDPKTSTLFDFLEADDKVSFA